MPTRVRGVGRTLFRLVLEVAVVAGLLVAAGALFAWLTGRDRHQAVTSALFVGAAVLVIWNGLAGGGPAGRAADLRWWGGGDRTRPPATPFEWVIVGVAVAGLGVVSAIV